ncbi:MAG: hypothetical protein ACHQUA_02565 [Microgenomates group bacterium]
MADSEPVDPKKVEIQRKLEEHPLYPERLEITEMLRDAREAQDDDRVDLLEDRMTDISLQMADDVGLMNYRKNNKLFDEWDVTWREIRELRKRNEIEAEEDAFKKVKGIAAKLEIQARFSNN